MLAHFKALTFSLAIVSIQIAIAETPATHEKKAAASEKAAASGHVMFLPADIKWSEGSPALPPGTKMSVLEGDPAKKGQFTLRILMPANYKIPAHWHPVDEHVTVISGSLHMGLGDKLDTAKSMALPVGGFALMGTGVRHFAWTSEEAVIQLHGVGPWGITYVNPADDPRKKSKQ